MQSCKTQWSIQKAHQFLDALSQGYSAHRLHHDALLLRGETKGMEIRCETQGVEKPSHLKTEALQCEEMSGLRGGQKTWFSS